MSAPKREKGLFTGAIRTGDTVQIDLNSVSG
jgi:hypothetical protein